MFTLVIGGAASGKSAWAEEYVSKQPGKRIYLATMQPYGEEGKARVKLIHYIQSFDPKDNVSIDTAQKIALDTVREMFGENVQAVIDED